ncbi:MAG: class 1 fructose-bisphosphatase [Azospirillum sp.]|nr:class 1 fructose-bisphosphatase [Azospirillum sp.]
MGASTLDAFLASYQRHGDGPRTAVVSLLSRLAAAAVTLRDAVGTAMPGDVAAPSFGTNADGDIRKPLDVLADRLCFEAARQAPVAWFASEERDRPVGLAPGAPLVLAVDPLDGSSNLGANISVGTIFSVLPAVAGGDPAAAVLQPGHCQLAAGFFLYGPQLTLVLTVGRGTQGFVYSPRIGAFVRSGDILTIPPATREFAINASNYRHWDEAVRLYVDDCLDGADGPREKDFNMRWIACLVGETYRILTRGGVFLYPGDRRPGYAQGRLRLVYEANPIAFLIEQAGGQATDTVNRILDLVPSGLHERVPLVFGADHEVALIRRYHTEPNANAQRAPLFGHRGLFRA